MCLLCKAGDKAINLQSSLPSMCDSCYLLSAVYFWKKKYVWHIKYFMDESQSLQSGAWKKKCFPTLVYLERNYNNIIWYIKWKTKLWMQQKIKSLGFRIWNYTNYNHTMNNTFCVESVYKSQKGLCVVAYFLKIQFTALRNLWKCNKGLI